MKNKFIIIIIIIILIIGGIIWKMKGTNEKVDNLPQIRTEEVKKDKIISKIETSGTVTVKNSEEIYVSTPLVVEETFFEKGDNVKKGDIIITYKDDAKKDLERNLEKSKLNLKNQKIELKIMELEKPDLDLLEDKREEINQKENSIEQLKISIENQKIEINQKEKELKDAEKDLKEQEELNEIGSVSSDELETSENDVESLQQNLKVQNKNLEKEELNLTQVIKEKEYLEKKYQQEFQEHTDIDLKKYIYQQEKLENEIKSTKLDIDNYEDEITKMLSKTISPFTGTIIKMTAEKNYTAEPQTALMEIADVTKLIIDVDVSEYDAPQLKMDQKVKITATSMLNKIYYGKVSKIATLSLSKATSNYEESIVEVEVEFEDEEKILKPGYSVDVEIITAEKENAKTISILCITRDEENKSYVYLMDEEGKTKKKYIETGIETDLYVEVLDLNVGEKVVINPSSSLSKQSDDVDEEEANNKLKLPNAKKGKRK